MKHIPASDTRLARIITKAHLDILFINHVLELESLSREELADKLEVTIRYLGRVIHGSLPLTFSLQRKLELLSGKSIEKYTQELEASGFIELYQELNKKPLLREALFIMLKITQNV